MPWLYFGLTFVVAVATGFAAFSHGAIFRKAFGQALQTVLSLSFFGFVAFAFWHHGWKVGFVEFFVVFLGGNAGQALLESLARRL